MGALPVRSPTLSGRPMRAVDLLAASLALSVATATPIASQPPAGVPTIGSRLRASTHGRRPTRVVGSLVRVTHDSLTLRDEQGVTQTISLADAGRIEMSRGKVGHPNRGAAIGIGAGLIAGAMIGSLTFSESEDLTPDCAGAFLCSRPTRGLRALKGASLGILIGATMGALIGQNAKTDRWTTISASSLEATASVRPTSNRGTMLSLAVRF